MKENAGRRFDMDWEAQGTWQLRENVVMLNGRLEKPDTSLTARTFTVPFLVHNATSMSGGIYNDGDLRKTNN
jgi:hypothetical protein